MQITSDLYKEILSLPHRTEIRLSIGDTGRLITRRKERITFGGIGILTGATGADGGYDESFLSAMTTEVRLFSSDCPMVGACVAGEIDVTMRLPTGDIPRQARLVPYVRLVDDAGRASEWLQKGVYFIDTRREDKTGEQIKVLTLHGYDAMLKAEALYPANSLSWPARDVTVVQDIARFLGVDVDSRTAQIMTEGYEIPLPLNYTCREVLGYIAAMYAGCFTMSDLGELRLVELAGIPKETRYLVTSGLDHSPITFGGVRILV